ncbi:Histidine ABC transporter [Klebsiella michiganensis]|uniref:Histidine ABC transporter n=1 Tax=Klebsiella michiganensis TaxID=1134687 RepID=A0A7H4PP29_9ENTR|nr:Histidine ABC transporter [Klebsiella michiganensis]
MRRGELVGFDIDLAKELCKRINTQCTFIENPLDALIPSLKAKKIDAIMSSLSITEKRQQEIAFTDKLYAADSRLVVKKGSDITPDLAKAERQARWCSPGYHPGNLRQRALGAKRH